MSFTIREATINDSILLFDMIKSFREEFSFKNRPFTNKLSSLIRDCFEGNTNITFFIAEYQGNILGYCTFLNAYSLNIGYSINIKDLYVKKEYRKMGVALLLYSKVINIAIEKKASYLNWLVDKKDDKLIEILKQSGVDVIENMISLDLYCDSITKFLNETTLKNTHDVHVAKSYELPDIFNCVEAYSKETGEILNNDVYKLMNDGFSMSPKFKIMVVAIDHDVHGYLSFTEAYSTEIGKYVIVGKVFVKKQFREEGLYNSLLHGFFTFVVNNNFNKIESNIDKKMFKKATSLKDLGVVSNENLYIASFSEKGFKNMIKN